MVAHCRLVHAASPVECHGVVGLACCLKLIIEHLNAAVLLALLLLSFLIARLLPRHLIQFGVVGISPA